MKPDSKDSIFFAIVFLIMIAYRPMLAKGIDLRSWYGFMVKITVVGCFAWALFWYVNHIAGLFMVLVLFSHYYPNNTWESNFALYRVAFGLGLYMFISLLVVDFKYALAVICFLALVNVIFLSYQYRLYDPYKILTKIIPIYKYRWMDYMTEMGIMANPNEASAFLALSLPAFLRKYWIWFLPFIFYGLICAKSFNGVLASGIGLIFYAGTISPWYSLWAAMATGTAAIFYAVLINAPTTGERIVLWKIAIGQWFNVPNKTIWFTGIGAGNWKKMYFELTYKIVDGKRVLRGLFPQGWIRLHSTYIESTIELGLTFPVLLIGYVVHLIRNFDRAKAMPYMGILVGAVLMLSNSVFKMNAFNGIMIIFWCAYAGRV